MWQSGKTVSPTAGGACGTDITPTTNLTESQKSAILITAEAYAGAKPSAPLNPFIAYALFGE